MKDFDREAYVDRVNTLSTDEIVKYAEMLQCNIMPLESYCDSFPNGVGIARESRTEDIEKFREVLTGAITVKEWGIETYYEDEDEPTVFNWIEVIQKILL